MVCRSCGDSVAQAKAPAHVVPGGLPREALLADILVKKYADHLPLYRQAQMLARQGVTIDRATLAGWVGRAAGYLKPIVDRSEEHTSELQSLMRNSYAVFCLKKKKNDQMDVLYTIIKSRVIES